MEIIKYRERIVVENHSENKKIVEKSFLGKKPFYEVFVKDKSVHDGYAYHTAYSFFYGIRRFYGRNS